MMPILCNMHIASGGVLDVGLIVTMSVCALQEPRIQQQVLVSIRTSAEPEHIDT
jgi:hypothetical protein